MKLILAATLAAATAVALPAAGASASTGLTRFHDPSVVTYSVHLSRGECHSRNHGTLPDLRCTPGSIDTVVTPANIRQTICRPGGYTKSIRPPESQTERAKFGVSYPSYGINPRVSEEDHLVPLELGGSNDITNLWPEVGSIPNPKDSVENALNRAVCGGRVTLTAAQVAIARNWETAETVLGIGATVHPKPVTAPAPAPAPAPVSCHPLSAAGNCYRPGEFCSAADHGMSGIAASGVPIICEDVSGWRWEG